MTEPTVCCVMLTRDRPELAAKAVECFRAQTYPKELRGLLIYNTGESNEIECGCSPECFHVIGDDAHTLTIGALRNKANGFKTVYAQSRSDILIHWDDDDYSHPNRIAEQVALLQASGADVVGYNEMLFWREMVACDCAVGKYGQGHYGTCARRPAEAWLYSYSVPKPTIGSSLCYWRKTWGQRPFNPKLPSGGTGEDWDFIQGRKVAAVSAQWVPVGDAIEPRMIARIHAGNTSGQYANLKNSPSWKRVPEWDQRVREILK